MRAYRVLGAAFTLCLAAGLWGSAGPFVPPAVAPLFAESAPPNLPQPASVQPVVSGTSLLVGWESDDPSGSFEVVVKHPANGTPVSPRLVRGTTFVRFDIAAVDFTAGPYCVRVRAVPQLGQEGLASAFTECAPVTSFVCDLDWQAEAVPGAIEVVVFGSARMDPTALDTATLRLGDGNGGGTRAVSARLANVDDAGGTDGYRDLIARFDMVQMRRNGDIRHDTSAFYLQAATRGGSPACGSLALRKTR